MYPNLLIYHTYNRGTKKGIERNLINKKRETVNATKPTSGAVMQTDSDIWAASLSFPIGVACGEIHSCAKGI